MALYSVPWQLIPITSAGADDSSSAVNFKESSKRCRSPASLSGEQTLSALGFSDSRGILEVVESAADIADLLVDSGRF